MRTKLSFSRESCHVFFYKREKIHVNSVLWIQYGRLGEFLSINYFNYEKYLNFEMSYLTIKLFNNIHVKSFGKLWKTFALISPKTVFCRRWVARNFIVCLTLTRTLKIVSHEFSHRTPLFDDRTRTCTFPTQGLLN